MSIPAGDKYICMIINVPAPWFAHAHQRNIYSHHILKEHSTFNHPDTKDIPIKFKKVMKLFQFLYIHSVILYLTNLCFTINPQIKPVIHEIFHFIFVYLNFCKFFNFWIFLHKLVSICVEMKSNEFYK